MAPFNYRADKQFADIGLEAFVSESTGCVLNLRVYESVPQYVQVAVQRFVKKLVTVSPFKHPLTIYLCPSTTVQRDNGDRAFGMFVYDDDSETGVKDNPRIFVGAKPITFDPYDGHKLKRSESLQYIIGILSHEYAHYEQLRDGKKIQERGVKVRACSLMRQCDFDYFGGR